MDVSSPVVGCGSGTCPACGHLVMGRMAIAMSTVCPPARVARARAGDAAPRTNGTAVTRTYDSVRESILSYEIKPNERLNEGELARRFHVSRTPLREALNRLVVERLLDFEPKQGFYRPKINVRTIVDLYEFRVILETVGVQLATHRASDQEIQALSAFWTAANQDASGKTKAQLIADDEAFHEGLIALSHNQELVHALKGVNARIHFIRWADTSGDGQHEESYRRHLELLEILTHREEARSVEVLRHIIERRKEEIIDVLKEGAAKLYMS